MLVIAVCRLLSLPTRVSIDELFMVMVSTTRSPAAWAALIRLVIDALHHAWYPESWMMVPLGLRLRLS